MYDLNAPRKPRLPPPPRAPKDIREIGRLRAMNAQMTVDINAQRKALRHARQTPVKATALLAPQPFKLLDPRRRAVAGTKVLQPLTPPLSVGRAMSAAVVGALREMTIETRALVRALANQPGADEQLDAAMDAIPDDAMHQLTALQEKWRQKFAALAAQWAPRMVGAVVAQSSAQLNLGLKDIAERTAITSSMATPRMRAIVEAATLSSAQLITRIPTRYLGEVQVAVMNAITTGAGLSELVPYLTKRYKGDARHAHLVALDQVRKASENVNAARLLSLGVEEYVWIAVGGERYPRELHHEVLHGKTFRYDDPPIIQRAKGNQPEIRGKPGDLIGCRCRQRPIVNFTKMVAVS